MLKKNLTRKPSDAEVRQRMTDIGIAIAGKRDEAVKERKSSGIGRVEGLRGCLSRY